MRQVGVQDVALEGKVGEFAFATDGDQAGGLKLFHMVGERGGADGLAPAYLDAGYAIFPGADLLQDFVASRIGQGLRDQMDLSFRKLFPFHHCRLRAVRRKPHAVISMMIETCRAVKRQQQIEI